MPGPYLERYDQRAGGDGFNAAFQRLGRLDQLQEGEELFLATSLSNGPYDAKLLLLDRTILAVSLAGALLTLALSLFLSRAITHPIAELLAGMERFRDGAWDTRVHARGGQEISRLVGGLQRDGPGAARPHIRETVLLKEYNEKIINSIRAGIAIVDRDLVVEKANSAFLQAFGLDAGRAVGAPLDHAGHRPGGRHARLARILSILARRAGLLVGGEARARRPGLRDAPLPLLQPGGAGASGCVLMADDISATHRAGGEDLPGGEALLDQHALRRHGPRDQQPPGLHPHQRAEPARRGERARAAGRR